MALTARWCLNPLLGFPPLGWHLWADLSSIGSSMRRESSSSLIQGVDIQVQQTLLVVMEVFIGR